MLRDCGAGVISSLNWPLSNSVIGVVVVVVVVAMDPEPPLTGPLIFSRLKDCIYRAR